MNFDQVLENQEENQSKSEACIFLLGDKAPVYGEHMAIDVV